MDKDSKLGIKKYQVINVELGRGKHNCQVFIAVFVPVRETRPLHLSCSLLSPSESERKSQTFGLSPEQE